MEFSGQYLTYEDYKGLGGTLDLPPFNLLEFEARRRIDIKTSNRLKELNYNEIPEEVKICEYTLINTIKSYIGNSNNDSINRNVASETTDRYSVSYITANQIREVVKSKSNEINDIIKTYLLDVLVNNEHIMYCGVDK